MLTGGGGGGYGDMYRMMSRGGYPGQWPPSVGSGRGSLPPHLANINNGMMGNIMSMLGLGGFIPPLPPGGFGHRDREYRDDRDRERDRDRRDRDRDREREHRERERLRERDGRDSRRDGRERDHERERDRGDHERDREREREHRERDRERERYERMAREGGYGAPPEYMRDDRCYSCGAPGHKARNCPRATGQPASTACYRCGGEGHFAKNCTVCVFCKQEGHFIKVFFSSSF